MRLKEDNMSWHARGVMCRDFRHTHGDPEVPQRGSHKKPKRPRRRIDHKHVWTDWFEQERYAGYWNDLYPGLSIPPSWSLRKECTVSGCKAYKWKKNPRYGYLSAKWNKERLALKASKEAANGR